jgi:hypothetical protein
MPRRFVGAMMFVAIDVQSPRALIASFPTARSAVGSGLRLICFEACQRARPRTFKPPMVNTPEPCEVIPTCPVCSSGPMKIARHMKGLDICLCENCGSSLSVPHDAWRIRSESQHKT